MAGWDSQPVDDPSTGSVDPRVVQTIIGEAGGDPRAARAVATVIRNRAQMSGESLAQVVADKGQFLEGAPQGSGERNSWARAASNAPGTPAYQRVLASTQGILTGQEEPVGPWTRFWSPSAASKFGETRPGWASDPAAPNIGGNMFFAAPYAGRTPTGPTTGSDVPAWQAQPTDVPAWQAQPTDVAAGHQPVTGGSPTGNQDNGFVRGLKSFAGGVESGVGQAEQSVAQAGQSALGGVSDFLKKTTGQSLAEIAVTGTGANPGLATGATDEQAASAVGSAATRASAAAQAQGARVQGADIAPTGRSTLENVLHGGGEMAAPLAAAVVNPLAGAAVFGAEGYTQAKAEAAAKGASPQAQETAGAENAAVQAGVGLIPFAKPLEPVLGAISQPLARAGATVLGHSAADAVMMGTMQAGSNAVAAGNYDPTRPLLAGVPQAAEAGALGGAVIHGATNGWNLATGRLRPRETPATADAAVAQMPETVARDYYRDLGQQPVAPEAEPAAAAQHVANAPSPVRENGSAAPAEAAETPQQSVSTSPEVPQRVPETTPPEARPFEEARASQGAEPTHMAGAIDDVAEYRAAAPTNHNLEEAMRDLGGLRTKDADGVENGDVTAALNDRQRPGLVNNKTGLTPEEMREALQQNGWFGPREPDAQAGTAPGDSLNDLYGLIDQHYRNGPVFHPDDESPLQHARRAELDGEMAQAGVSHQDSNAEAAAKVAEWRDSQDRASGADMFALQQRADALDVAHYPGMTYEELLGDVVEREAIQGEHTHGSADQFEHLIDDGHIPFEHDEGGAHPGAGASASTAEAVRGGVREPEAQPIGEGAAGAPHPGAEGAGEHPAEAGAGSELAAWQKQPATERVRLANETVDQTVIPGAEGSAQQAARARGEVLRPKAAQQDAGGLFAPPEPDQGALFQRRIQEATDTPEFKAWFGSSKVVDKDGKPLAVYHGTNQPVDDFLHERLGTSTRAAPAQEGFFFTSSPDVAGEYAAQAGRTVVANAIEHDRRTEELKADAARLERAAARTGNWDAYETAMQAWEDHEMAGIHAEDIEGQNIVPAFLRIERPLEIDAKGGGIPLNMAEQIRDAKAAGHDGVIIRDIVDPSPSRSDHYVVFDSKQVKSPFNRGDFDPNDPRISFHRGDGEATPEGLRTLKRGVEGKPIENAGPKVAGMVKDVEALIRRIAPAAKPEAFESLRDAAGGSVQGATWREGLGHAIVWALDSDNHLQTGRHEAVHVLEKLGLFRPAEMKAMREAAGSDKPLMQRIRDAYPDLAPGAQMREAIAQRYAEWQAGVPAARDLPSFVKALFQRVKNALAGLGDIARKAFGKDVTADAVYRAIESGEVGRRDPFDALANDYPQYQRQPTPGERQDAEDKRSAFNKIMGEGVDEVGAKLSRQVSRFTQSVGADALLHDLRMNISPMAEGSPRAQASAKDFANSFREHAWEMGRMVDWLGKTFTREQLEHMWKAADEHGVLQRQGVEPGVGQGLNRLAPDERAITVELQKRADAAFDEAAALKMTRAEKLESYVPRMVVEMSQEAAKRVGSNGSPTSKEGRNLFTTTGQLQHRKYETVAETEEAAQKHFGGNAIVVKDIRTLALATGKLEQAIAGRRLIDKIKQVGQDGGQSLVSEGGGSADAFTMDHPAMKTWSPVFAIDNETGKLEAVRDPNGQIVWEQKPLYISKEFEGPLRAVLTKPNGLAMSTVLGLKGKIMSMVMFSPLMHNAVIWGKALPADPGGVLTFGAYRRGYLAKTDPPTMREAIRAGLDPVGHRYFNQDVTGLLEDPTVNAGRSWTAQLLGKGVDLFSKEGGQAVREAIDKIGDVWHNTFLWDRVGDLQMGLYVHMRDTAIKHGMDDLTAQRFAAHFANRYAGALPIEAMSKLARNTANLALFSRSFNLTNMGAYKDALRGLPSDVQAQIERDSGIQALLKTQGTARAKGAGLIIMDIALAHVGLLLASGAMYGLYKAFGHPQPFQPPWQNEQDRQNRFLMGYQPDGTAIYGRLPTGKFAEDLVNWVTEPITTGERKLSPFAQVALQIASNDKGFGRKLYDPYDKTPAGFAKNVSRVVMGADLSGITGPDQMSGGILGATTPVGEAEGLWRLGAGIGDRDTALMQTILPWFGITVSKGAPGGPQTGDVFRARDEQTFRQAEVGPGIRDMIAQGKMDQAHKAAVAAGVPNGLYKYWVRSTLNPAAKLSTREMKDFMRYATPDQKSQFQADRQAAAQRLLEAQEEEQTAPTQ